MDDRPILVRSYDVGFGDCIYVQIPDGEGTAFHMLIDCGTSSPAGILKPALDDALSLLPLEEGKRQLDLLVVTHPHADHIKGFNPGWLEGVHIRRIWLPVFMDAAHPQAGVAPLGHDGHAGLGAGAHRGGHFGGAVWAHHGQCPPAVAPTPVLLVSREVAGRIVVREHMGVAHHLAQRGQQRRATHAEGDEAGGRPAARAALKRKRTCSAQATNSSTHRATCPQANAADRPLSLVARTMPSVKYSHTSKLSQR